MPVKEGFITKSYEYKFVELPAPGIFKPVTKNPFHQCQKIILAEAQDGWRLKQVVSPFQAGLYSTDGFQIIFEREIET